MRPHKKLASIYARAPTVNRPKNSVLGVGEKCGPLATADAALGDSLDAIAGKQNSDGAKGMQAQNKRAVTALVDVDRPFKFRGYTKGNSVQMTQAEARCHGEVQAKAQSPNTAREGGQRCLEGNLQLHWPRPHHDQPLTRNMDGRQLYEDSPYIALGHGKSAGSQPSQQQQQQKLGGFGAAAQLSQSSVGEIMSNSYEHIPPVLTGRMNDLHRATITKRFRPSAMQKAHEAIAQGSRFQSSKLDETLEQLRCVVSSVKGPMPAKDHVLFISHTKRVLEDIVQSAPLIAPSERAPLAAAVLEVQCWVQRQLLQRMDEMD
jgi:hypothetical protein